MLLFLFLFGLALATASPSGDREVKLQQGDCTASWYNFNGRCYKYYASRMTWADAEFHCVSESANLVSIHSLSEDNFVKSLIKSFDPAQEHTWIGLSDIHKEGRWMWSDGSAANFFFWDKGQPNNSQSQHCVHSNFGSQLKWNDILCAEKYAFVCIANKVCP